MYNMRSTFFHLKQCACMRTSRASIRIRIFPSASGFVNIIYEFLIFFLKSVALLHVRLRTLVNTCTAADIQISEKL